MITLNGKDYKLYYLDTCALSELVKDRSGFGSSLLNIVLEDGIIAFSVNSIWELKSAPVIYKAAMEVLSVLPSMILKTGEMIFDEEYKQFKNSNHEFFPYITPFSASIFKKNGIDLLKIVEEKVTNKKNDLAKNFREDTFQFLRKNPSNIYSREDLKDKSKLRLSVEMCAFQLATQYRMIEIGKFIENNEFPINNFPSLISMAYLLHYKYLQADRKGSSSDVEDILMSALYPYVDVVVTERNQCEIIRQIKNYSGFLSTLNTFTLSQIKALL
ncbi:hypothetical protein [Mucilaginibacter sp.]|uniref:hypothetical protein n=1 Tax=Mucilaginibacter sp. TaxID=1882438 RepID=UPI002629F213|nr:hypothetical protein [Mucilaginibacter sp.]MDB4918584.1 hypothetical protein [Mucilaginibacter sp.]